MRSIALKEHLHVTARGIQDTGKRQLPLDFISFRLSHVTDQSRWVLPDRGEQVPALTGKVT